MRICWGAHSASALESQRPRFFNPGGHSPTRGFVVCASLVHAFYRTSVRSNVCSVDVLRVVWYRAGAFLCLRNCMCDVAVHDRGRAVAVAVVHGRAWPSCVWPWCRVRLCVVVMSWRPGCVCGVSCLWWCRGRDVALRMV